MNKKLFLTGLLLSLFFLPNFAIAQKDHTAELKKNLVTIEEGNYKAFDFMYLKFSNGNTMQIKISATCPVDIMSRDNFVSMYSTYGTILLLATFAEAGVEMPDIKDLDELIGEPDITYNFVMTKNGMQIQVGTNQGKENVTMKWDEVFAE